VSDVRRQVKATNAKPAEVKLEAPGKVVARGRFKTTFQDSDAGDEEFVISETDDGFHVMAHNRPKGGWNSPSITTMNVGKDFALHSAEWRQQADPPLTAKYSVKDGKIEASATKSGDKEKQQSFTIPEHAVFSAPCYAIDFITLAAAGLKVGETKKFN